VLEEFNARFYTFRVSANDGAEVVGHGAIKRAIVSKGKFERSNGPSWRKILDWTAAFPICSCCCPLGRCERPGFE